VPMQSDEQKYGVEVANAAILGCAFSTRGQLDVNGTWEAPNDGCPTALQTWAADERAFHPSEVVVEMGYRDEFHWRWNGALVHLGEKAFDNYVEAQVEQYVKVLGAGGTKVLFLSVPYTDPPDQADGAPAPAASRARHTEINGILAAVAKQHPGQVGVLNIDSTISPGNHYDAKVNGQDCRFDGIHFTLYCGKLIEPQILSAARGLIGS
jgi:hypothetical protein